MFKHPVLVILAAISLFALPLQVHAQEASDTSTSEIAGSPIASGVGYFSYKCSSCPDEATVRISLHRIRALEGGVKTNYTHLPPFFPLARDKNTDVKQLADFPELNGKAISPLIWSIDRDTTGVVYVGLRFEISNPDLKRIAEETIRASASEAEWITSTSGGLPAALEEVAVIPWPIERVGISIGFYPKYEKLTFANYSLTQTDLSSGWFEIALPLNETDVMSFSNTLSRKPGQINISYSYVGAEAARGIKISASSVSGMQQALEDLLTQKGVSTGSPIAQAEIDKFSGQFSAQIQTVITTNDPDLLARVPAIAYGAAFERMLKPETNMITPTEFAENRSAESLEEMLRPIYEDIKKTSEQFDETTATNESKKTISGTVAGSFNVGAKAGWGGKGELSISKTDLERIEREWGTRFTTETNTEVLTMNEISVRYVSDISVSEVISGVTSVVVEAASGQAFQGQTVVSTASAVPFGVQGMETIDEGMLVPVGTALCSFIQSPEPPAGYMWLKAGSEWPSAAWAGHLAGTTMPSFNDLLLGSTEESTNVGLVTSGILSQESSVLSLSNAPDVGGVELLDFQKSGVLDTNPRGFVYSDISSRGDFEDRCAAINWSGSACAFLKLGVTDVNIFRVQVVGGEIFANEQGKLAYAQVPISERFTFSGVNIKIPLPGWSISLNEAETMPRHIRCRWMMRVE